MGLIGNLMLFSMFKLHIQGLNYTFKTQNLNYFSHNLYIICKYYLAYLFAIMPFFYM